MTADKTYAFTRGIDTVHVTIGGREIRRAKTRLWLVIGGPGLCSLLLGFILWPLLVVGAAALLALAGRLAALEQETRARAEHEALRHFDRFEAERWRAIRALGDL